MPAGVPSLTQTDSPRPSSAMKTAFSPSVAMLKMDDPAAPGRRSVIIEVPRGVPSLRQSSAP